LKQEKTLSITLEKIQGLIAGDGELPVKFAQNAKKSGFEVVAIALSNQNRNELKKVCDKVYALGPGEVIKIRQTLVDNGVKQVTFLGKVSKNILLSNPRLDSEAIDLLKKAFRLNDDAVMDLAIQALAKGDIEVMDQTLFIQNLMVPKGVLTKKQPTPEQIKDVEYGYEIAKQMGDLDIGQSVVIKDKMIMAIEAIEGTDCAIERGGKLAKSGAVVVKVSKPNQDKRFDIPTVGLRTLKKMKSVKANILALEANETIIVQQEKMIEFADKNNIVVMAI
jgi:DUF1009 family protein